MDKKSSIEIMQYNGATQRKLNRNSIAGKQNKNAPSSKGTFNERNNGIYILIIRAAGINPTDNRIFLCGGNASGFWHCAITNSSFNGNSCIKDLVIG